MVSIRKMHPASPGTIFGARAEEISTGAAALAALSAAIDEDFFLTGKRLV
jgi:hypothetical protein